MDRNELIEKLKPFFSVKELVCPHCYNKFKDNSWQFLSTELLSTLYVLRTEILNKPMIINTWARGGQFSQRGLRCNMCRLVKDKKNIYLSQHILGRAIDFNVPGMSSDEVNKVIQDNADKFEYPVRLELFTSGWSHIDTMVPYGTSKQLTTFKG